jgi:hypothetical protein
VNQRGRHIPAIRLTGEYVEVERFGRRRARTLSAAEQEYACAGDC